VYDAINRITEIHRPNGISTYNTYNARNQITELVNTCDDCEWTVSSYAYTYDDKGFIVAETAIESLAGYAYDDKHDGKHEDGKHDDLYPHGNNHSGKHDKDATFAYQIVQTDRTFTYDDTGKLLSANETEDNYGTYVYTYEYDLMGNRTAIVKTDENGDVTESRHYTYNDSNQLTEVELYNGKKTTTVTYEYDADGNLIAETGKDGNDKVELTYAYTVENRLEAVYDGKELLMAAAYDGDGNRVFQLNYNLHTDEDWKGNSGNGNGSNKDNSGSGNSSSNSSSDTTEDTTTGDTSTEDSSDSNSSNGNGNNKNKTKNGNSSANNGKGGNGKNKTTTTVTTTVEETVESVSTEDTTADTAIDSGTADSTSAASTGNGNATNAETNNSQNQSGILFPIDSETSDTEEYLIGLIKTTGKEKNYELIEYINDVNREYTEVLVEQNINGADDTTYVYGVDRLSLERFDGSTGYYLYDPRGSVTGITNEEGQIYQSYRYNANGEITFGAPRYENEYTYNGESYNPNIESQYLRARYYDVTTAAFITEDSYLGDITEPLTLNRYNYCVSSPLNYVDPSGHFGLLTTAFVLLGVAVTGGFVAEGIRSASQGDEFSVQAGFMNAITLTATGAAGLATVVATGGNPVATGMAMYTTFCGFNSMNQSTMQGKSDGEALLDGLYGALKGGITFGVAVGAGTLAFNTLCAAGMPMWAVITGEGIAGGIAGGTTNRLLNGMEVNAETIFIDGFWGGATAATMYGAAKLVNYVISSRMPAGTSVADDAALANQMSQVDDCDNALGTNRGVGNPVNVEGRGSTGRVTPNTLNEQMAMQQVQSNPLEGAIDMSYLQKPVIMTDPRWPAFEGWVKMSNNVNGVEIHFVYNKYTGAFDDFKFK